MEDDTLLDRVRRITFQLNPYVKDSEVIGKLSADLTDLAEECEWFISRIKSAARDVLSSDDLEGLLIDIDVRMLGHALAHIKSLKREVPRILDNFPNEDEAT